MSFSFCRLPRFLTPFRLHFRFRDKLLGNRLTSTVRIKSYFTGVAPIIPKLLCLTTVDPFMEVLDLIRPPAPARGSARTLLCRWIIFIVTPLVRNRVVPPKLI